MSKEHSQLPWVMDGAGDSLIVADMESQADQLLKNAGTPLEWRAVGVPDPDGLAEIVALAHPTNAEFIVRCVNAHADLVDMVVAFLADQEQLKPPFRNEALCEEADELLKGLGK